MIYKDTEFKLTENFISKFKSKQPQWGPLGLFTYKRSYARDKGNGRTEEYWETCQRVVEGTFLIQKLHCRQHHLTWNERKAQQSAQEMYRRMWEFKFLPPGRGLWAMGTDFVLEKSSAPLYNCGLISTQYIKEDFSFPFVWLMDMSLMGVGVGFDTLGADKEVYLKKPRRTKDVHVIEDSREGWVDAFKRVLDAFAGTNTLPERFDYSQIRPAGSPIKTFGGIAPGSDPLQKLLERVEAYMRSYVEEDKAVDSTFLVDLMNFAGACVVAGGTRRTAEIAFGSPKDEEFLSLKAPDMVANPEFARWASNNSVSMEIGDDYSKLAEQTMVNGEPGYVWLDNARHYGRLKDPRNEHDRNVMGTNPCVTGDTWVMTGDGPKQVKSLLNIPFKAVVDGKEYVSPTGFFTTGVKPTYKVTLDRGYSFKATEDHLVKVMDNKWVAVKDLKENEHAVYLNNTGTFIRWGGKGNQSEGWLVGSVLGNGGFDNKKTPTYAYVRFWGKDREKYQQLALTKIQENCIHRIDLKGNNTSDYCQVKSVGLKSLCFQYFDANKNLLPTLEEASSDFAIGFLRGLFDADGSVQGNFEKGISIRLSQSNESTLKVVQRMLLRLGITSTIYSRRPAQLRELPTHSKPTKLWEKKSYWCKEQFELIISRGCAQRYYEMVGFLNEDKQLKLSHLIDGRIRKPYHSHYWGRVASVVPIGEQEVYDCQVDSVNCFDGNGMLLHNCGEITLHHAELCVSAETKIQTKTGCFPIVELVGKEVEVWNGKQWSSVIPFQTSENSELLRVTLSDGSFIDCTKYHRFDVKGPTKRKFQTKKAEELKTGDILPDFSLGDIEGYEDRLAYEYGLFAGDGFIDTGYPMISMPENEIVTANPNGAYRKPYLPKNANVKMQRVRLDINDVLAKELRDYSIGLPNYILSLNADSSAKFVAGLIDSNGSINNKGSKTEGFRIYGTEAKIRDIQLLLRRAGVNYTGLSLCQPAGTITNKGARNHDLWCIDIASHDCRTIPTRLKKITNFGSGFTKNNKYIEGKQISNKLHQKIAKVEPIKSGPTYCFYEPLEGFGVFGNTLTRQCNIVETFPSNHDNLDDYLRTLKYAFLYCKTVTLLATHNDLTNQVQMKNRRIGVSQSGIVENVNKIGLREHLSWCDKGYQELKKWDQVYSDWLCIRKSIKLTTVKPSGTVSLLPGKTPGIHYPHSEYYIRRIRVSKNSDLVQTMQEAGYTVVPDVYEKEHTMVVEFPVHEPNFSKRKADVTMWEQLELAALMQYYWADNSVSITVTVKPEEGKDLSRALEMFESRLKSVSFLPLVDHKYEQAPYEETCKSEFDRLYSSLKKPKFKSFEVKEAQFCDADVCEYKPPTEHTP